MKLAWNQGINRLILLISIGVGMPWAIYCSTDLENPLPTLVTCIFVFPLAIGGGLLLLKALSLWITSGFTKPPEEEHHE